MLNDVIEAECQIAASAAMQARVASSTLTNERACQIAYHQEGERLSRASFPILRDYSPTVKPFYRKVGGLHFLSFGPFRLSFCVVSHDNVARKTR